MAESRWDSERADVAVAALPFQLFIALPTSRSARSTSVENVSFRAVTSAATSSIDCGLHPRT
ncbi:hypothetical protein [Nocardia nova]|uniref:hypothetical protein n=1 Tax=Nocardia nova TaxID=37330 RepID=UPI00130EAAE6|nr:hypothetical protein [Nocardia nova]